MTFTNPHYIIHIGQTATPKKIQQMWRAFELAMAAIGLSASIASAATIPVENGSFETIGDWTDGTWARFGSPWAPAGGTYMQVKSLSSATPDGGVWSANIDAVTSVAPLCQSLNTSVSVGDTVEVTFWAGRMGATGGVATAYFNVGGTSAGVGGVNYTYSFDTTGLAPGEWQSFTMTKTMSNSGSLSLGFYKGSGGHFLDGISNVTVTPVVVDPNAPSTSNATLTVDEDVETALAESNFGYSDPNSVALAAVQITSLPALGTLKLSGTAVTNGEIVAAADITNLTYQSALNGNGAPYTPLGIKVENASNLWSIAALMMVNVTPVNDSPTSTGGSVSMKANTVNTFAAGDFPFSDVDTGDMLGAIMVTSLPAHGTLKLAGTTITAVPSDAIPVADIGTLTYEPNTDYSGADSFNFQMSDGTDFSVDATMAITVTVNVAPTSTGGAVILRPDTFKTFAAGDFPFLDADSGDTLSAIKVTSLPAHGTLKLNGTPIIAVPSAAIPVASIGTFTYTPAAKYDGPDSFQFQVSDGTDFSADATMTITVSSVIFVQNGSFETHGFTQATYWAYLGEPWVTPNPFGYDEIDVNGFDRYLFDSAPDGNWIAFLYDRTITQDLLTTVNVGETLSVTFSGGNAKGETGGVFTASFLVGSTAYTSATFDTSLLEAGSWHEYTFTAPIANTGNLSLEFSGVSGRPWLDKVSNVSVTPPPLTGTVLIVR